MAVQYHVKYRRESIDWSADDARSVQLTNTIDILSVSRPIV